MSAKEKAVDVDALLAKAKKPVEDAMVLVITSYSIHYTKLYEMRIRSGMTVQMSSTVVLSWNCDAL